MCGRPDVADIHCLWCGSCVVVAILVFKLAAMGNEVGPVGSGSLPGLFFFMLQTYCETVGGGGLGSMRPVAGS